MVKRILLIRFALIIPAHAVHCIKKQRYISLSLFGTFLAGDGVSTRFRKIYEDSEPIQTKSNDSKTNSRLVGFAFILIKI